MENSRILQEYVVGPVWSCNMFSFFFKNWNVADLQCLRCTAVIVIYICISLSFSDFSIGYYKVSNIVPWATQ